MRDPANTHRAPARKRSLVQAGSASSAPSASGPSPPPCHEGAWTRRCSATGESRASEVIAGGREDDRVVRLRSHSKLQSFIHVSEPLQTWTDHHPAPPCSILSLSPMTPHQRRWQMRDAILAGARRSSRAAFLSGLSALFTASDGPGDRRSKSCGSPHITRTVARGASPGLRP